MTGGRAVEGGRPFGILTVCTGNVCRSPAAQLLLARGLGPTVNVMSAGTGAVVGAPVDPGMAALLERYGTNTDGFAARQVTEAMLRNADLILTMTQQHRSTVVEVAPAVVRRSFTLLEFAHLLEALGSREADDSLSPGERLRALLPAVRAARPISDLQLQELDVPDPFAGDATAFERAWNDIRQAASVVIDAGLGRKQSS